MSVDELTDQLDFLFSLTQSESSGGRLIKAELITNLYKDGLTTYQVFIILDFKPVEQLWIDCKGK